MPDAAVFGNVALDVICKTVNEVPRYDSLMFEESRVTPGGCGSNVAIGLAQTGIDTALIACVGQDDTASLLRSAWERTGMDLSFVQEIEQANTGVSVGLVDDDLQPRFIHTPGANAHLDVAALSVESILEAGIRHLHIAGYFVLPGLLDRRLANQLAHLQRVGIRTSLDVVTATTMEDPSALWPCLPFLDLFLCNRYEASLITGVDDPRRAASSLHGRGANTVIVKLGAEGCWVSNQDLAEKVPAPAVETVVDTTGAGDAFAAGLIAALLRGAGLREACQSANRQGARAVQYHGAVQLPEA